MRKYLSQGLIAIILLFIYHGAVTFNAKATAQIIEHKISEPDIQTLTINQPRVASIVEYAILKDVSWHDNSLHLYAIQMNKAISEDVKSGLFYGMVAPSTLFDMEGSQVIFREDWIADIKDENRDISSNFPRGGLLVMHLEKILYPQCPAAQERILLFVGLSRKGVVQKRDVTYREERDGWRVIIGGADDFDVGKLSHRALVKRGCRKKIVPG
jgi:hypothetical protein